MADAVVDPKIAIDKKCHQPCVAKWKKYEACVERIKSKPEGTCEPWAMDYWHCVDGCAAKEIFRQLK